MAKYETIKRGNQRFDLLTVGMIKHGNEEFKCIAYTYKNGGRMICIVSYS